MYSTATRTSFWCSQWQCIHHFCVINGNADTISVQSRAIQTLFQRNQQETRTSFHFSKWQCGHHFSIVNGNADIILVQSTATRTSFRLSQWQRGHHFGVVYSNPDIISVQSTATQIKFRRSQRIQADIILVQLTAMMFTVSMKSLTDRIF